MAKEFFVDTKFTSSSRDMIAVISLILDDYKRQGYDLSLRQLYYQLVARGVIENSDKSYKRIGSLVNDARLAGLLDWSMIQDRGRPIRHNSHWNSPKSIIRSARYGYHTDWWKDQPWHVEVMVEKQALEGVLIPVCEELDVTFSANKGYSSASALYNAGLRIVEAFEDGKNVAVIYLGDHDPSGIDMTRDVEDRLRMFGHYEAFDQALEVRRIALNMEQVDVLNPPPNPAKETDARFESYRQKFGDTCWELDAIEPSSLAGLVRDAIYEYRDIDIHQQAMEKEQADITMLERVEENWEKVVAFLEKSNG